jgi:hypothetical protein
MLNVKRLGAAVFLMGVLEFAALADCPNPGIMQGPPCVAAAQTLPNESNGNSSTEPGIMNGPPAATAASAYVELPSLIEVAFSVLTLY